MTDPSRAASRLQDLAAGARRPLPTLAAVAAFGAIVALGVGSTAMEHRLARVLLLVVVAPLVEESIFRAGVQEALLRSAIAPVAANAVTAAGFALVHVVAHGDPASGIVVVPALLLGAVYNRWGRLRYCVALHAAMNGIWLCCLSAGSST